MKGFDTWALLEILEGSPAARKELRRLRGEELATTEACFLELGYLAARGGSNSQLARRTALARLRRRLTVLPLDARAIEEAARHLTGPAGALPPAVLGSLGAFEAAGCDELLTSSPAELRGRWRFKVRRFGLSGK